MLPVNPFRRFLRFGTHGAIDMHHEDNNNSDGGGDAWSVCDKRGCGNGKARMVSPDVQHLDLEIMTATPEEAKSGSVGLVASAR